MTSIPLIQLFQNDVEEVIDKYTDQGLTVGETIGALEMCKLDLYRDIQEDDAL